MSERYHYEMSDRYARQIQLSEIGIKGQDRLRHCHILVIGAGGLACPALQYLIGAGVGTITIVDGDHVSLSNLHRQTLYREDHIGEYKVDMAAKVLRQLNSDCKIIAIKQMLSPNNADSLLKNIDIILDCADSFAVSYILSDHCAQKKLPLISASALGYQGYVGAFCGDAPSLRAVFPDLPSRSATCDSAGILGTVVGLLGAMQAQMAIAHIVKLVPSPMGRMLNFDLKTFRTSSFNFSSASETNERPLKFISAKMITNADLVVELREKDEAKKVTRQALRLSVADINQTNLTPEFGKSIVFCCRTGLRAWQAARKLQTYWDGDISLIAMGDIGALNR